MHPLPLILITGFLATPGQGTKLDAAAVETGLYLYNAHCAVCHGKAAEGDGPMADQLRTLPSDLTRLAARNKGKFPAEVVAKTVDGREPVKGHGGFDMPIWGDAFRERKDGYSEAAVKERISKIVQYLETLQRK